MANILIITAVFPPEPVVSAGISYDIADAISKQNSVTVISPKPSRPYGFSFPHSQITFNFTHIVSRSYIHPQSGFIGRFRESYSFGKYCYDYIIANRKKIDLIYANTWPLMGQYYVVKAAKKYDIPLCMHIQDIYPESLSKKLPYVSGIVNRILLPLDRFVLKNSSAIVVISNKMKNYLAQSRKLNILKLHVIPNWQDEETFLNEIKPIGSTSRGQFTFMYLGNIGPVADVDKLLNTFEKAELRNARLVIAGAGTMKESLVKDAAKFPHCNIEFWPVPEGKVPEIQSIANVLILPLKKGNASYSIPSKLAAYMLSGKPIIACVEGDSDTAAAIKESNCGYVVEPDNVASLAIVMKQVYNMEKTELEKMGLNGKEYAISNLSKKANLPKVMSVIEFFFYGNNKVHGIKKDRNSFNH